MFYKGSCRCNDWQAVVDFPEALEGFNPRGCDCDYCQQNPSALISDPNMEVSLKGNNLAITQNGDQIAHFYSCGSCGDFLAVGCKINGQLRGAFNANLLDVANELGSPIRIQPRLLSADEKLDRWGKLWGVLRGV